MVAVVVSRNPGTWFRECLEHLAAQDYPALATLIVDAASTDDPEPLVHEVIPTAAVHRLDSNPGYGAAANLAPELVSGAAFYLFLHDDIALAPDAVTRLVEESFRSNAGIAGPKLLDFDDPGRIRSVGNAIDKAGVFAPYAEPGELDQEQHDRVRDVFSVQGGCILVRSDLFATLEGFDAGIDYLGDDLDLCWRAHVVGARVLVAPTATARHREAMAERGFADERRRRLARHRVRTIAKCYGWLDLLLVLPQAFLMALAEAVFATITGRFRQARDVLGAWVWNIVRVPAIFSGRRRLKRLRRVRDRDIRRLQVRGSARLTAFFRGQIGEGSRIQDFTERGRALAGTLGDGPRRMAIVVWTVLAVLFLFGARHLITRDIVPVGQFVAFPDRGALLHSFGSGWSEVELGSSGPAPAGLGLLGLASSLMLGATALLRQLLILGLIPLGWIGVWRLSGPLGSRRGRLVAAVVYAAIPIPYDAVASARWDLLLLYGSMPFVVLRLARLIGVAPYGHLKGEPGHGIPQRSLVHQIISLGLVLAVIAAFEPFVLVMVPGIAAVMVVASGLTGTILSPIRAVILAVMATAVAAALHLPWLLRFAGEPTALWSAVVGVHAGGPSSLTDLMRFDTGRFGDSPLLWGVVVVAGLSLVIGRDWRAAWAPRAAAVALGSFAAAWIATNDILAIDLPDAETLLVPAAVGLAWAAAISFASFEHDVPRFGDAGRRLAVAVGVGALAAAVLPAVGASTDGDYGYPDSDLSGALRFITADESAGTFRVLWLGEPDLLPVPGREVASSLAIAVSSDGLPDVRSAWLGPPAEASDRLLNSVRDGLEGDTTRLGRLLVPFGVRYVVVPQAFAPSFADVDIRPADPVVLATLASQLDLRKIASDPSVVVYENIAWRSVRAAVTDVDPSLLLATEVGVLASSGQGESVQVLGTRHQSTHYSGPVDAGTIVVALAEPDRWRLEVGGVRVPSQVGYGWSAVYDVDVAGDAELIFTADSNRWLLLLAQWVAWVLVARIALSEVRFRKQDDEVADDDEGETDSDEVPAETVITDGVES